MFQSATMEVNCGSDPLTHNRIRFVKSLKIKSNKTISDVSKVQEVVAICVIELPVSWLLLNELS